MPTVVAHLLQRLVRLRVWTTPALVIVVVFVTSWPLMILAEPAGNPITRPRNYWWWFLVTTSTVGYGDFYPETAGGHAVGVYVIVGGIATLTTLFTHVAARIEQARGRRMRGTTTLQVSGHTVVLGYTSGRTERLVDELFAERERPVVLRGWDEVGTHPLADRGIDFVRGDLADADVLRRAGTHRAHSALVGVRDDNEALTVSVAVHHVNPHLAPVVTLRDMARAPHLHHVDSRIRCVQWHTPTWSPRSCRTPASRRSTPS